MRNDDLKYSQVLHRLRDQIAEGTLKSGDRLPSFNEMKRDFGISRTTIEKVHGLLEQESLIVREHGRGTFVAPRAATSEAQEIGSQRLGTLGILGGGFSGNQASPYWASLFDGIRQAAHRLGFDVMLLNSSDGMSGWEKVDGVLVYGYPLRAALRSKPLQLPSVHLLQDSPNLRGVMANDAQGAQLATQHLLELGHRRIGYLLLKDRTILPARHGAYRQALRDAGIRPHSAWTRHPESPTLRPDYYLRLGEEAMTDWLRDETKTGWKRTGCTALLCQNDETAVGAMAALRSFGFEVPRDVSVVGFDGTQISDYCTPRLTTIEVPLREIGARGVETLHEQIESRRQNTRYVSSPLVLPVKLKIGASSAPPQP